MADFPTTPHTFTDFANGATTDAAQVTDIYEEVEAIEAGYLQGTARLNSSNSTVANLNVTGLSTLTGAVTVGGSLSIAGALRIPPGSTTLSGASTRYDNVAIPSTVAVLVIDGNSTAIAVSGFSTRAVGAVLVVVNGSAAGDLTLLHEDGNSSATGRLQLGGSNKTVASGAAVWLVYATAGGNDRWRGL